VDADKFAQTFKFKTMQDPVSKKIIRMDRNPEEAGYTRHATAKALYGRLFDWLVERVNKAISRQNVQTHRKLGLLDIYGFEVFESNSFEQLCINFANEKLQQHFNHHIFKLEQQLYTEERVDWSQIEFKDNQMVIDSLEKRPLGVFCILDSECIMPRATDESYLQKIYNSTKDSQIVYKPTRFASMDFAVAHYAGEVVYDVTTFLDKNMDKLHGDVTSVMKESSVPLIVDLFTNPAYGGTAAAPESKTGRLGAKRGSATRETAKAPQPSTVREGFSVWLNQRFKKSKKHENTLSFLC
jgi:myosin-5